MKKKFQFSESVMKKIHEIMTRVGQTDFEKFIEEDLYYERVVILKKSEHLTASHEVGLLKKQVEEFRTKVNLLSSELNQVHGHLLQLSSWLHPSKFPKQNINDEKEDQKDGKIEEEAETEEEEEDEEDEEGEEEPQKAPEKLINLDKQEDDDEEEYDDEEIGNPPLEDSSDLLVKGFTASKQYSSELWKNATSQEELDSILLDSHPEHFPKRCTGDNFTFASKWLHQFAYIKTDFEEEHIDFAKMEEEARKNSSAVYVKTGGRPCFVFRFTNQDGLVLVDLIHPFTHCLEHGTRFQQSVCTAKNRCKIGNCSNKHPCKLSNIITSCGCARVEEHAIRSYLEFPKIPQKIYN